MTVGGFSRDHASLIRGVFRSQTLLFQMPMLLEKIAWFLKNHFTRLSDFPPGAFVYIELCKKFRNCKNG
jgi:hypothetical protein